MKVRIEALQRANGLLSKAVPTSIPNVMAPIPSSAKKRGLPQEFVAPDPGPTAIVTTTATSATDAATRPLLPSSLGTPSVVMEMSTTASHIKSQTQIDQVAKTAADVSKVTSDNIALKSLSATAALASVKARKPLATVQPQSVAVKASEFIKTAFKPTSLSSLNAPSKPPFKPTLSSKPLPKADAKDTKSLLAALQALKRTT